MGDIIREARERVPETQDELSFRSGVSQGWLSQVELGHVRNPSAGRVRAVAGALGLDARVLFAAQFDIPFGEAGEERPAPVNPPPTPETPERVAFEIARLSSLLAAMMGEERASREDAQSGAGQ